MTTPTPAPEPSAGARPGARFVARPPILTKDEKVFGYELLFRDGVESYFCPDDPGAASRSTLDSLLLMGLDVLCNGSRAFINCTRDLLLKDHVTRLPSSQVVVEVLQSVEPDALVIAACQRMKESRVHDRLDDFAVSDRREPLTHIANERCPPGRCQPLAAVVPAHTGAGIRGLAALR